MANRHELYICTKWKFSTGEETANEPDFGDVTLPIGTVWMDVTGQPAENLPCTPNLYLIQVLCGDAVLNAIQNSARFFILARRTWDDASPGAYTFDNFNQKPTAAQLQTFKDTILARFPDADEDKLTEAGQAILQNGLTRIEIIQKLTNRWRQFLKAVG